MKTTVGAHIYHMHEYNNVRIRIPRKITGIQKSIKNKNFFFKPKIIHTCMCVYVHIYATYACIHIHICLYVCLTWS